MTSGERIISSQFFAKKMFFFYFQKGMSVTLCPNDFNKVSHSQIFNVLASKKKKRKLAYLFLACSTLPPEFLAKNKKPSENNAVFGTYNDSCRHNSPHLYIMLLITHFLFLFIVDQPSKSDASSALVPRNFSCSHNNQYLSCSQ